MIVVSFMLVFLFLSLSTSTRGVRLVSSCVRHQGQSCGRLTITTVTTPTITTAIAAIVTTAITSSVTTVDGVF